MYRRPPKKHPPLVPRPSPDPYIWPHPSAMSRAMLQLNYKPPEMLDETGAVR